MCNPYVSAFSSGEITTALPSFPRLAAVERSVSGDGGPFRGRGRQRARPKELHRHGGRGHGKGGGAHRTRRLLCLAANHAGRLLPGVGAVEPSQHGIQSGPSGV